METRAHRRAVLATGARLAYAAPVLAASMQIGRSTGDAFSDWPANYDEILCGCHGPEWRSANLGGTCAGLPWTLVLQFGGCGDGAH